jgi:hypothetical protein
MTRGHNGAIVPGHDAYLNPPRCLACGKKVIPVKVRKGWLATCYDCGGFKVFINKAGLWNCNHASRMVKIAKDGSWKNIYCRICFYSQFTYRFVGGAALE